MNLCDVPVYTFKILQYLHVFGRLYEYNNIMYNIQRAGKPQTKTYYNTVCCAHTYIIYRKIKYYYSFNVNNPVNTCQHLLINYPAVSRRHRARPCRVQHHILYYYYYHTHYTIIIIFMYIHPIIMVEYLFVIVHFRVLNHAVIIVCESEK